MIPKTLKSPVLCVIDRALTGIKHFSYITQNVMKRYINKQCKVTFDIKYIELLFSTVVGTFLNFICYFQFVYAIGLSY